VDTPLTVIVPTCDRSRTLYYTLSTLAAQDYKELEVIVSDNASTDDTTSVIDYFVSSDSRFRRLKHVQRLSMSKHWELALEEATGRYIAFLGDDDGMMPNGCRLTVDLLKQTGYPQALVPGNATYYWPDTPISAYANVAIIPLSRSVNKRYSNEMLSLLRNNQVPYNHLPGLYRSWVEKSSLEHVRARARPFFRSCQPDVYSGIAMTSYVSSYYFSYAPIFIEGVSGFSNGARSMQSDLSSDNEFFTPDTIPFHSSIPFCTAHACLVAESLQQCHDAGLLGADYLFEPRRLITEIMAGAVALSRDRYRQCVDAVRKYAASQRADEYAEGVISQHSWRENNTPILSTPARIVRLPDGSESLVADTAHTHCENIKDIFDLLDEANVERQSQLADLRSSAVNAVMYDTSMPLKPTIKKTGVVGAAGRLYAQTSGHLRALAKKTRSVLGAR
jgi:hypothetical protein